MSSEFEPFDGEGILGPELDKLRKSIQRNCLISDAGFSGIYSMCTLILRLRNLFKWENGMAPWSEPEPADLLEWIDAKEKSWEALQNTQAQLLIIEGRNVDPMDGSFVNSWLGNSGLLYGAGFGRSMKPVFFLAEKLDEKTVEGFPVFILGKELARELAAPFAMAQENVIYIRREPLRFYFWDQIQEIGSGSKKAFQHALQLYNVRDSNSNPDRKSLIEIFDEMVDSELEIFIYHEVGELTEDNLESEVSGKVIDAFPHSAAEYLVRAVKDLLADTHPKGVLPRIIDTGKESSLSFYVGFLDGLRSMLFPEIVPAYRSFLEDGNWLHISRAVSLCRRNMIEKSEKISCLSGYLEESRAGRKAEDYLEDELLAPLGIGRHIT